MLNRLLLYKVVVVSMLLSPYAFADKNANKPTVKHECEEDNDCKDGKVCYLAVNPRICVEPQPTGSVCLRDELCASKNCDVKINEDVGVCK